MVLVLKVMFPEADDETAIEADSGEVWSMEAWRVEEEEEDEVDVEEVEEVVVGVDLSPWLTETGEVMARRKRGRRRWELSWGG